MKGTLGHLHTEMDERFAHLHDTDAKFEFIFDVKGLCYSANSKDLKTKCENLGKLGSSYIKKFWIAECCYNVGPT